MHTYPEEHHWPSRLTGFLFPIFGSPVFVFIIMLVYHQPFNTQSHYIHYFFQDNLSYQNMYAAVMSHECLNSYMSINPMETTKQKLNLTETD